MIALILVLLLTGAPRAAEPIDAAEAARCFAEAHAASDRDAGHLWGVRIYGPMLFVDPATRRVVANRADAAGLLSREGDVFTGEFPADQPIANTSVEWGGVRWAMILWPLPEDASRRVQLMLHESFHRIQPEIGIEPRSPANAHLDALDGRYLMRLEWRALRAALESRDDARRRAVEDALAFRTRRRALYPAAEAEERALELNEGLAEYTGCAAGAADPRARAVELLAAAEAKPTYTRSFAYGSGPAYGVLLDAYGGAWRRGLDADSDLGELLAKAAHVRESTDSIETRAARYGGAELHATEVARDRARRERADAYRKRFVDGPVLRIPLAHVQVSFDPNTLEAFGDLGTVYPTLEASDTWGTLHVTGGAMLAPDWSAITVAAPSGSDSQRLSGDGWTLDLAPGWHAAPGARPGDLTLAPPAPATEN